MEHLHKKFDYIQLSHTPIVKDVRQFTWADWEARVRYTYQMDLSDLEALWERVERRTRTVIRKAEKNGFQVHATDDVELFRHQYELIYARQNTQLPVDGVRVQAFVERPWPAGKP